MRPRREIHAAHGHFERLFTRLVQRANRAQLRGRQLRIVETAVTLHLPGGFHARPDFSGRDARWLRSSLYGTA